MITLKSKFKCASTTGSKFLYGCREKLVHRLKKFLNYVEITSKNKSYTIR